LFSVFNPLECEGNYIATSNNNEVGTLAVDGWAVTFCSTHPSTASVPITVFLCNGPLLCGFNVDFKGLIDDDDDDNDMIYYRASAHYQICLSVCASVCLSVCP